MNQTRTNTVERFLNTPISYSKAIYSSLLFIGAVCIGAGTFERFYREVEPTQNPAVQTMSVHGGLDKIISSTNANAASKTSKQPWYNTNLRTNDQPQVYRK